MRVLGDGHVLGEPGYGSVFYGSGTLAYQFGGGPDNPEGSDALLGIGVAVMDNSLHLNLAGPQFVFGLGRKAGFGQVRVIRLSDYNTVVLLLGGVRF